MADQTLLRQQVVEAAAELFYVRGIQAVGMDAIRDASGVSLKRLYRLFPSKDALVSEFLRVRGAHWRQSLAEHVALHATPEERIVAVFDWLLTWFSEPDYRGCAFINSFGELGAVSPEVAQRARDHKDALRAYLAELVAAAGRPTDLTDQLTLLVEGATTTAAILNTPEPARQARKAACLLMDASRATTTAAAPGPPETPAGPCAVTADRI